MDECAPGKTRVDLSRLSVDAWCIGHRAKGAYEDSRLDALESRPNLFELWENGSHMLKLVAGRNSCFPKSLVVPCAWIQSPKSLSLRDAVRNVAHHEGGSTTRDYGSNTRRRRSCLEV